MSIFDLIRGFNISLVFANICAQEINTLENQLIKAFTITITNQAQTQCHVASQT